MELCKGCKEKPATSVKGFCSQLCAVGNRPKTLHYIYPLPLCPQCKEREVKNGFNMFCSRSCAATYRHANGWLGRVVHQGLCGECGREFTWDNNSATLRKFCSMDCFKGRKEVKCAYESCNTMLSLKRSQRGVIKYCSREHANKQRERTFKNRVKTRSGHYVRSQAEAKISDWLRANRVWADYEPESIPGFTGDWQVVDANIYIEYWGGFDGELAPEAKGDYAEHCETKRQAYADAGAVLIELYPEDLSNLDAKLGHLK